jgi:hypothetical protein
MIFEDWLGPSLARGPEAAGQEGGREGVVKREEQEAGPLEQMGKEDSQELMDVSLNQTANSNTTQVRRGCLLIGSTVFTNP